MTLGSNRHSRVLSKYNINTVVHLPGVGENLYEFNYEISLDGTTG